MEYGNQFSVTKTFYEWCVENNRLDLNERFDVDKNGCTTKDVGYQSNKKYWFKCPRGLHESEEFYITVLTRSHSSGKCRKCNSVAQVVIDKYGEDYLWSRWHSSNDVSPWEVPAGRICGEIIIQCQKHEYHVYGQAPRSFVNGIGCPYCINRKVHPLDSLGAKYSEILDRWSEKNDKTPYEYAPHSEEKVWFTCPNKVHEDYLQKIANAAIYGFTCRKCENERAGIERRGANNHFWKGGINGENDTLRHRSEYKNWRTLVYERDNYTCQCCGKVGGRLNAHHVYSFSEHDELRYSVDNGITLCKDCHDSTKDGSFHNLYGTHNNTLEQLREYILNKSNIDIFETHPKILSLTTKTNIKE